MFWRCISELKHGVLPPEEDKLKEDGAITEQEFEEKKKELLKKTKK
ncbi:SHOCT domain-containing protein [Methanonatronarchaeum sp. AMET-Sl]|nr:SHOCT domain-containing protein [Methanonatronarchaeum sp. AMET-Sl]WGI16736.1 SHOCT domain-containing protein [Methanonatronarchaeum sp. AMET-Sl]